MKKTEEWGISVWLATLFPVTMMFLSPGSKSRLSAEMFMGDCNFPSLHRIQSLLMRQLDGPKVGNDRVKWIVFTRSGLNISLNDVGFCSLGQELDIYQIIVVSKWTWTEEVLTIFLTPPLTWKSCIRPPIWPLSETCN